MIFSKSVLHSLSLLDNMSDLYCNCTRYCSGGAKVSRATYNCHAPYRNFLQANYSPEFNQFLAGSSSNGPRAGPSRDNESNEELQPSQQDATQARDVAVEGGNERITTDRQSESIGNVRTLFDSVPPFD